MCVCVWVAFQTSAGPATTTQQMRIPNNVSMYMSCDSECISWYSHVLAYVRMYTVFRACYMIHVMDVLYSRCYYFLFVLQLIGCVIGRKGTKIHEIRFVKILVIFLCT